VTVSLVPSFNACTSSNRRHGNGLPSASCSPAVQTSSQLTVGAPDANGNVANSSGYARFDTVPGNTGTTQDEADLRFAASMTDVRRKSDLTDYSGELQATVRIRITDRDNTPTPSLLGSGPGTVVDTQFPITVPCAVTSDTAVGSTCAVSTTADSVVPGAIREGVRTIWELGQIQVLDGGPDGLASSQTGNTLFAKQGFFVP
jgi:hypothetical protein